MGPVVIPSSSLSLFCFNLNLSFRSFTDHGDKTAARPSSLSHTWSVSSQHFLYIFVFDSGKEVFFFFPREKYFFLLTDCTQQLIYRANCQPNANR